MTNKYVRVLLGIAATTLLASTASANLLVNGGFEDTPFAGAEEAGAGEGWTAFGGAFRIQGFPEPIGSSTGAHGGTVVFKAFFGGGAFQDIAVNAGDTVDAGVWMLNPNNPDDIDGAGFGAVNLEFRDAGGNLIGDVLSNATFDALSPVDVWTLQTISGVAPAGTAFVRFALFADLGGAPRFDDAFLEVTPIPVPGAILLMGSGLLGLIGLRRKKVA